MGKTAAGAVWLDGDLLSPYDYYQYWINCDDRDVGRFLKMFTFLSMAEIRQLDALDGSEIRQAKQVLAFQTTRITHGDKAAEEAQATTEAAFGKQGEMTESDLNAMPTTPITRDRLAQGISPMELFAEVGLTASRGEARRLIKQGGMYINDQRIDNLEYSVNEDSLTPDGILLRAGKKKYHRLIVE